MKNNLTPFPREDRILSLMREYVASPLFDENTHVDLRFEVLGGEVGNQFSIEKLIRSKNRLLIYGPPGSGKSETINYIRHKFAKRYLADMIHPIPIYYLTSKIDKGVSLLDAITSSNNLEKKEVLNHLNSGKSLLLLDEIDGVIPSELPRVIYEINSMAFRYPKSRIIVASRTLFIQEVCQLQPSFKIVSPLQLDQSQIRKYLRKRFPDFWREIFSQIVSTPWLSNIIGSPLMLSLLSVQMTRSSMQNLIGDPLRIIAQFIDAQISKPSYTQRHPSEVISIIIENIAGYMNVHNRAILDRKEIYEISASRNFSQSIIETALNSGIFIENSYDLLSFAHLTFYELRLM